MLTGPSTADNAPPPAAARRPTWAQVCAAWALGLIAIGVLITPIAPHDFWWHLAVGREIAATGHVPTTDQFTWTRAGEPYFNQPWLAQLGLYALYQHGGAAGMQVVQALVVAGSYALLLALCRRRSGDLGLASLVLLLAVVPMSLDNWNVRPQTLCLPLFVGCLWVLSLWRADRAAAPAPPRRAPLWLLPILMAIWVNVHGTFVLGGAMVALSALGELLTRAWYRLRSAPLDDRGPRPTLGPLLLWGAIAAAAILLNPRGAGVLAYVANLVQSPAVTRQVTEWAPPTLADPTGLAFFVVLVLALVLQVASRLRPRLGEVLVLLALAYLAARAGRNIIWFAAAVAPLLAAQLAEVGRRWRERHPAPPAPEVPLLNGGLIALLLLGVVAASPWFKARLPLPERFRALLSPATPVKLTQALANLPAPPRRLFNAMSFGSYLPWAAPDARVFIDTRIELFPAEQWQDYFTLSAGQDLDRLMARYDFDGALLDLREQAGLLRALSADGRWREVARDPASRSVLLIRVGR